MSRLRRNAGFIDRPAANRFPGYFAVIMATGATSIASHLLGLMLWRHLIHRHRIAYEPQLWSMVFPLAMYTTGTLRLSAALELPFLMRIPELMTWLVLLAWGATSAGMFHHFWWLARAPRA